MSFNYCELLTRGTHSMMDYNGTLSSKVSFL